MSEMRVGRPAAAKCAATRSASATLARPSRTEDRKSTRLNSSHLVISYAVFCLKQKTQLAALRLNYYACLPADFQAPAPARAARRRRCNGGTDSCPGERYDRCNGVLRVHLKMAH